MATPVGIDGSVTFLSGHGLKPDSFQLLRGQRMINTTGYESGGDEENSPGLRYGRYRVSGHFKKDAASTAPGFDTFSTGSVTFQIATGCTWTVNIQIETATADSDVNGGERVTYEGPTSGAVTETWDETTS